MRYGVAAALPAGDRAARGALRRLLTPTFRLENLLVFIPLRVVAAKSGAAQFDRRGQRSSFVLVELLIGAAGRRWSSGGRAVEVRGRGRVAGGRSSGQGGSASSAHSDFPAGKSAGLYPFAGGGRQIWRGAVRPARAADFVRFSGIVDRRCGATMELRAVGLLGGTGSRPRCRRAIERPGGLCVVCLTPTFRLENLLVFIPLRVVAADLARRSSTGAGGGFRWFSGIVDRRCGATMELGR